MIEFHELNDLNQIDKFHGEPNNRLSYFKNGTKSHRTYMLDVFFRFVIRGYINIVVNYESSDDENMKDLIKYLFIYGDK